MGGLGLDKLAAGVLCVLVPWTVLGSARPPVEGATARNVILMVADGMGLAAVTAARGRRGGVDVPGLSFESLPRIGYQRTHAADGVLTDSAAAASAWACGEKFANGEICQHGRGGARPRSVLEHARDAGRSTGLVATSAITHATPAAFGAHAASRECEGEIARQYLLETGVDVLLGGGFGAAGGSPPCPDVEGLSGEDLVLRARREKGYAYVTTAGELSAAVSRGNGRVLGLFAPEGMAPAHRRGEHGPEPSLADLTRASLEILARDEDGFFLLVEASQVDWAAHAHDLTYLIAEVLAFDDAVRAVLEWLDETPDRREDTLLVVMSDHETGGLSLNGGVRGLPGKDGEGVVPGWTTRGHTGVDTLIWSRGPGSHGLGRALDNTELYGIFLEVLGIGVESRTRD